MIRSFLISLLFISILGCDNNHAVPQGSFADSNKNESSNNIESSGIRLTWQDPELREDGTELNPGEIIGYAIRISQVNGEYPKPTLLYSYNNYSNEYELDFDSGIYEIEIAAITDSGVSDYSEALSITIVDS